MLCVFVLFPVCVLAFLCFFLSFCFPPHLQCFSSLSPPCSWCCFPPVFLHVSFISPALFSAFPLCFVPVLSRWQCFIAFLTWKQGVYIQATRTAAQKGKDTCLLTCWEKLIHHSSLYLHRSATTLKHCHRWCGNTDLPLKMQCSAGKLWVLALMSTHHPSKHCCRPSTPP